MVDKKINAVFIHIPKTAGIYIQKVFDLDLYRFPHRVKRFKNKGHVTFGHLSYRKLLKQRKISREFHRTAFKFAFCRNPYDRAVSHYFYVIKKHPDILTKGTDFLGFTESLNEHRNTFRPQSTWIKGINIDFIGRYERLHDDLYEIAKRIGKEIMPFDAQNTTDHEPFYKYYCNQSKENIRKFYKVDFETFGYDNNLLH